MTRLSLGAALVAALSLTACVGNPVYEGYRSTAIEQIRAYADRALEDGRLLTCDAPTAGALRRSYWQTQEGTDLWWDFCNFNPSQTVNPPGPTQ